VAALDGVIQGVLILRMFEWLANQELWHGAMIGMVYIDPEHRGAGLGSRLLSSARHVMEEAGVDFGVLWTGNRAFYEHSGWFSSDRGVFGRATPCSTFACTDTLVSRLPAASADSFWIERLRAHALPMRVKRNSIDYCTVPIPAVDVTCFYVAGNRSGEGFALVGESNGVGYLYELTAPPPLWGPLWSAISEHFSRLCVNGLPCDSFAQWLDRNGLIEWAPQNKTMWLRVSDRLQESSVRTWHIPYYDWI
jgi:hypothetical protein